MLLAKKLTLPTKEEPNMNTAAGFVTEFMVHSIFIFFLTALAGLLTCFLTSCKLDRF